MKVRLRGAGQYHRSQAMSSSQPSAGWRVAHTFELLEQILLATPGPDGARDEPAMLTIFVSQRAARVFRDTIANSPPLRAMIFCSAPDKYVTPSHDNINHLVHFHTFKLLSNIAIEVFSNTSGSSQYVSVTIGLIMLSNPESRPREAVDWVWRKMHLYSGGYEMDGINFQLPTGHPVRPRWWHVAIHLVNPTVGDLLDCLLADAQVGPLLRA
ncbi:hypothetical protein HII31_11111 [Pseudocercospora fuligena]|uniref:Uncharacterized protein n=1 Tax=Pseudocercospora fuligena TaxID=685502 RepID=A0A8H6RBJ3_9PEZI|nr:hypothetical protein HII31_11111 [Pseudocercospora fuligena]